jgi:hypothetical protein
MSVQEIQSQIAKLSAEEQFQLEAFLKTRRLANSIAFREKIEAAHSRMDAGNAVTATELRAMLKQPDPITAR